MEKIKSQVLIKYKDDKEKLEEFKKLYTIYTKKEEVMLEYEKINKQFEDVRRQLLIVADKSKKANHNWDEVKEQLNEFSFSCRLTIN